jgi:hypothetical protein
MDIGQKDLTIIAGYSWKTNQYGLIVDTVTAFELVKPNGEVVTVTKASDPSLFFGLKVRVFNIANIKNVTEDSIHLGRFQ